LSANRKTTAKTASLLPYAGTVCKGFLMGSADIVPGVSGGTMAFITGIYERLLSALAAFDFRFVRLLAARRFRQAAAHVQLDFLIALGLGVGGAVVSMAGLLHILLQTHRVLVFAFFFGLVVASAWVIGGRIVGWRRSVVATLLLGIIGGWLVTGLVPVDASHAWPAVFFSGAVAISAMLMPGVSGAFLLLVLGQYEFVTGLLRDPFRLEALQGLGAFAFGCLCGIAVFSRLLRWWLRRFPAVALAFLTGFMLGAVRTLWPWAAPGAAEVSLSVIVVCMGAGFALVVSIARLAHGKENKQHE